MQRIQISPRKYGLSYGEPWEENSNFTLCPDAHLYCFLISCLTDKTKFHALLVFEPQPIRVHNTFQQEQITFWSNKLFLSPKEESIWEAFAPSIYFQRVTRKLMLIYL